MRLHRQRRKTANKNATTPTETANQNASTPAEEKKANQNAPTKKQLISMRLRNENRQSECAYGCRRENSQSE